MQFINDRLKMIKCLLNDPNNEILYSCLDIPKNIIEILKEDAPSINFLIKKIYDFNNENITENELLNFINHPKYKQNKKIFEIISPFIINDSDQYIKNSKRDLVKSQYNIKKNYFENDNPNKKYIYNNQMETAIAITNEFFKNNKKAVTLIALPQVGKTGTFLYTAYLMATHKDDKKVLDPDNIFIITGMSDKEWQSQTEKDMLQCFENNVYHNGKLNKFKKVFQKCNGQKLIIIDESHIGIKQEQRVDKTLCILLGIKTIMDIINLDCLILSVSATPGATLKDMENYGEYHSKINIKQSDKYVGFKLFLDQKRLEQCEIITDKFLEKVIKKIKERYTEFKYHIFRVPCEDNVKKIEDICRKYNFDYAKHNSINRLYNFEDKLDNKPDKHTFIFIKQFFRAGKRLNDTHIGIVYEYSITNDMEKTPQGLVGRFCGNDKNSNSIGSPYFYCDVKAIEDYVEFMDKECDFTEANYKSNGLKVVNGTLIRQKDTFAARIKNKDFVEKLKFKNNDKKECFDVPYVYNISNEEYRELTKDTITSTEKERIFKKIIKEHNKDIYNIISNYTKKYISQPDTTSSYHKNFISTLKLFEKNKIDAGRVEETDNFKNLWFGIIDNEKFYTEKDYQLKIILIVYHGEKYKTMCNIEDDISENENDENKEKRKSLPKAIRVMVWDTHIGKEKGIGYCYVCNTEINAKHFECGHIQAKSQGGLNDVQNLRPICSLCNKSIGSKNMDEFKKEYNLNK